MHRLAVLATLVACGSSRPGHRATPLANATATSAVRLAVAGHSDLSMVDVSPAGTRVLRTAKLPSHIDALDWLGDDPIVLLQRGSLESCGLPEDAYPTKEAYRESQRDCEVEASHDGTIGRLTATGFVAYPRLPDSTWDILQKPTEDGAESCTTGCWSMSLVGREVWQGRCKWVFFLDGRPSCDTWAYARIDVPSPATLKEPPVRTAEEQPLPTIAAPENVSVDFESVTPPPRFDGDEPEAHAQLTCSIDDKQVSSYPDPKELDAGMMHKVTWLAASPPIFAAWHLHEGFEMTEELVIFESCKKTGYDSIVTGPGGVVALVGSDRIELRKNGALLGTTDGGVQVVFAP